MTRLHGIRLALAGVVGLVLCGAAAAQPDDAAVSVDVLLAVESSRGHYGDAELTRITTHTATFKLRGALWRLEAELPWLEVRTQGPAGGLPGQATRGGSFERGQGDAWLRLGYELRESGPQQTGLDLVAKIKTRTGNAERGLGSGGTDYALQLEWLRPLGPVSAFGEIGWRRTGDVAGARPYHDPWYGELGLLGSPAAGVEVGAYVDWRERIGSLGPLREYTAYAAWKSGPHRLQVHAVHGTTRASPDRALGLTWRVRF